MKPLPELFDLLKSRLSYLKIYVAAVESHNSKGKKLISESGKSHGGGGQPMGIMIIGRRQLLTN